MDGNSVSNVVMTQFTSSAVVVYVMQKLKNAAWFPLLKQGSATISRVFSVVAAALVAVGINYTWNPATRGLLVTIPTLAGFALGLWHWLNQFALQETVYQATVNKISLTTVPAGKAIPAQVTAQGQMLVPPVPKQP
jgi:hypothetical protein